VSEYESVVGSYYVYILWFADNVAMRGERLELLVNKTENLSANVSILLGMVLGNDTVSSHIMNLIFTALLWVFGYKEADAISVNYICLKIIVTIFWRGPEWLIPGWLIFLFCTIFRLPLVPNQSSMKYLPKGALRGSKVTGAWSSTFTVWFGHMFAIYLALKLGVYSALTSLPLYACTWYRGP
jgi:hypothetical protein